MQLMLSNTLLESNQPNQSFTALGPTATHRSFAQDGARSPTRKAIGGSQAKAENAPNAAATSQNCRSSAANAAAGQTRGRKKTSEGKCLIGKSRGSFDLTLGSVSGGY